MFFKKNKDLNPEQHKTMTLLEKLCSLISTFYCFVENVCNPGITLDNDIIRQIKELAENDDRSFSQYVNMILKVIQRHLQS